MTQPTLNTQGLMAALCAAATWGMVGVFVRWLPGWSAFAVLAGRFLVATVAMLPILFLAPSVRHDLIRSLRTSPLFIIAYKYVVRLHVKRNEGFGMLLAMAGASAIVLPQLSTDRAVSWATLSGYLLALGAAGSIAIYTLWFNAFAQQNIAPKSINVVFLTCLLGTGV
jgi:drug/metabolite transporter (DMT)-like permease